MLKELRFVQGSVSKKELLPAMTHFAIENGTVRGYNGTLALCSPIPFDIDCKPKAEALVKAIANCTETVTLSMTVGGKLRVQSGKFRVNIECVEGMTPHVVPEGQEVQLDGEALLNALKVALPFVGNDASRPWSNGVLLRGQSAFATNNVCLIEYWVGATFPLEANIPRAAVKEMVRINEPPTYAQVTSNSITFHYADGKWIRSQLFELGWPDLSAVLDRPAELRAVDPKIFEGLDVITPFADKFGRVHFQDGTMMTHPEEDANGEDIGASFEVPDFPHYGIYRIEMLKLLRDVAVCADFSTYPQPCIFQGDRLRGAIVGMKL
ncbi:DNA polymerase III [Pseudomonas phage MiCath]|uniref:DNA polymerase III n=1 Tax=Pseudomonas phage MiCath TaxID=3003729 RepID=A0AAE9VGK0_9CAUD|nr:DNA polymerase III [Pseudomonas phage MiCath]WAX22413.1 DNA polymerase III [Pseudomonas phage MiCath]